MNIAEMSMNSKVSLLKELYNDIASKGQDGDTMLAHINPYEAELLKAHGGSGTINPTTGLPEFKSAVKSVVKVAKKVVPYVAVAAAVYYAPTIAASIAAPATTAAGYGGAMSMMSTLAAPVATSGFGLSSLASGLTFGNVMSGVSGVSSVLGAGATLTAQTAGLGTQAAAQIQSQKYASQASGFEQQKVAAENKSDEIRNRYNQMLQKRSRLNVIRQARINQGRIGGSMGGTLGAGGTSGYVGAIGSLGSQASANIGNINVAEGYGNMVSASNLQASNFGSMANTAGSKGSAWKDVQTLGGNIFAQADQIGNVVGKVANLFT